MDWNYRLAIIELYWMEKQQAEFADSPMLKFSTYSAGLRQGCILKVSEPEVHRCGEFGKNWKAAILKILFLESASEFQTSVTFL